MVNLLHQKFHYYSDLCNFLLFSARYLDWAHIYLSYCHGSWLVIMMLKKQSVILGSNSGWYWYIDGKIDSITWWDWIYTKDIILLLLYGNMCHVQNLITLMPPLVLEKCPDHGKNYHPEIIFPWQAYSIPIHSSDLLLLCHKWGCYWDKNQVLTSDFPVVSHKSTKICINAVLKGKRSIQWTF